MIAAEREFKALCHRVMATVPGQFCARHLRFGWSAINRDAPLKAVFPLLAGLLIFTLSGWMEGGLLVFQQALWFLPFPLFASLYLRVAGEELVSPFSPRAALACVAGFVIAACVPGLWQTVALLAATAAGLGIFLRYPAVRAHMAQRVRLARAACIGACSGLGYLLAQFFGWKLAGTATANIIWAFLSKFIPDMSVFEKGHRLIYGTVKHAPFHRFHRLVHVQVKYRPPPPPKPPGPPPDPHTYLNFMAVASNHAMLKFYVLENVLNGIFLLAFVLSLALVLAGDRLERRKLVLMYGAGALLVFIANALILTLCYLLVELAYVRGAGPLTIALAKTVGFVLSSPLLCFAGYGVLVALVMAWFYGMRLPLTLRRASA